MNQYMFISLFFTAISLITFSVKPGSSMFDQTPSYNPAFAHHNTNYCQCDHGRADCTKTKAANPLAKVVTLSREYRSNVCVNRKSKVSSFHICGIMLTPLYKRAQSNLANTVVELHND